MTPRYDLFVGSIHQADLFLVQMFLFALAVIAAYPALGWLPAFFRRPMQWFYLSVLLALYLATVYLSATLT